MPSVDLLRRVPIVRCARVMQFEGLFDLAPVDTSETAFHVDLPIEQRAWQVGLIVGPSGSGKSSIAREIFGQHLVSHFTWDETRAIVAQFSQDLPVQHVAQLLCSVGFSSPPAWLRPYSALSTGEQFRVTVARALASNSDLLVIDEFTSVVDRTVAQIGSAAVARAIRSNGKRFIAVTCHYDVLDWLQPDWVYDTGPHQFYWRSVRRYPDIGLEIFRVNREAWRWFRQHHYLNSHLHKSSHCFAGTIQEKPAAFTAVISFPHSIRPGWREHRTVCLPDFQGVGIGNAMSEFVAGCFRATGKPYFSTTSHPAMIRHRARSRNWRMNRCPSRTAPHRGKGHALARSTAIHRLTAGFEYVGEARTQEARLLGVI